MTVEEGIRSPRTHMKHAQTTTLENLDGLQTNEVLLARLCEPKWPIGRARPALTTSHSRLVLESSIRLNPTKIISPHPKPPHKLSQFNLSNRSLKLTLSRQSRIEATSLRLTEIKRASDRCKQSKLKNWRQRQRRWTIQPSQRQGLTTTKVQTVRFSRSWLTLTKRKITLMPS